MENNIEDYLFSVVNSDEEIIKGSDETIVGGSVLDNLEEIIKNKNIEIIYSCGPIPVLKGVCEIAKKYNTDCQIAMEKVMACSIGVCRGCIINVLKDGEIKNASVCKDGPVFNGYEVIWN